MSGHSAFPGTTGTGVGPAGVWNLLFLLDLCLFPPMGSRVRLRGVHSGRRCAFGLATSRKGVVPGQGPSRGTGALRPS